MNETESNAVPEHEVRVGIGSGNWRPELADKRLAPPLTLHEPVAIHLWSNLLHQRCTSFLETVSDHALCCWQRKWIALRAGRALEEVDKFLKGIDGD